MTLNQGKEDVKEKGSCFAADVAFIGSKLKETVQRVYSGSNNVYIVAQKIHSGSKDA